MKASRRHSKEKAIGDILPFVYKKLGLEERMSYALLSSEWEEIVGPVIAKHSKPTGVAYKCLMVEVDSPVWLNELNNFSKGDILRKVKEKNKAVKDIRFKIGIF